MLNYCSLVHAAMQICLLITVQLWCHPLSNSQECTDLFVSCLMIITILQCCPVTKISLFSLYNLVVLVVAFSYMLHNLWIDNVDYEGIPSLCECRSATPLTISSTAKD